MSIVLGNFYGIDAPVQRIRKDSNLRMVLLICGLIAVPSIALAIFLTGWVQYVFALVVAINVAVPVMAYLASLNPPAPLPDEEFGISRGPQIIFEEVTLPISE